MDAPSSDAHSDEKLLAKILLDLEQAEDKIGSTNAYVHRYPYLESQIRGLLQVDRTLQTLGTDEEPSIPPRLGDFRIVRRLARGGMGEIYEAVQEPLDRRVAVKVMRKGQLSANAQARFLREQKVLARLHQTHIVPIHTAGQEGTLQYFAMPYIDGAALHHVVRRAFQESWDSGSKTPTLAQLAEQVEAERSMVPPRAARLGKAESRPASVPTSTDALPNNGSLVSRPTRQDVHTGGVAKAASLSNHYFRSVAEVMADAADALHVAHDVNILHRDLKPSNFMVDSAGHCWIIDFGLATYTGQADDDGPGVDGLELPPVQTATGAVGTPPYMAPEQFEGQTDVRTDVWGLGVTMYELLTLCRPFAGPSWDEFRRQITTQPPPRPRRKVGNLPHDLEAICLKAMEKDSQCRYPSARDFAEDLRRWLHGEPSAARPARPVRRTWLWARRNKGWASALLALIVLCVGGAAIAMQSERMQRRESAIQQIQNIRLGRRTKGWSVDAWDQLSIAARIRKDWALQSEAAAILIGLDAKTSKRFEDFGAGMLAIDRHGNRLLMGYVQNQQRELKNTRLWDLKAQELRELQFAGAGPVAFRADGTPVQLGVDKNDGSMALIDLDRGLAATRFTPPKGLRVQLPAAKAMTTDGSLVVAQAVTPVGDTELLVWHGESGTLRHRFPIGKAKFVTIVDKSGKRTRRFAPETTSLAFSLDGSLLAAGNRNGEISIYWLAGGEQIASLKARRTRIHCLAFSRDRQSGTLLRKDLEEPNWLLAAGDAGGTVTIWNIESAIPLIYCHGSEYDVYTVMFSPDGTILASAGRRDAKLWDVATGRELLALTPGDFTYGLVFSPDGRSLAISCSPQNGPGLVSIWDLQFGRGIRMFRGLVSPISKICFSPSGRLMAALSHDWQVAIWDVDSGDFLKRLDVPQGLVADNSALAFSPDGHQFAFSAGKKAKIWDVDSGRQLKVWPLPEGLVDKLSFAAPNRLLLFRVETEDGTLGPYSNASPLEHPRVCRIRNLLGETPTEPVAEIKIFNWHVYAAAAAPDGSCWVVDGLGGPDGKHRMVRVFDAAGNVLHSIPMKVTDPCGWMRIDPSGNALAIALENGAQKNLLTMPECRFKGFLENAPLCLSPGARYWATSALPPGNLRGLSLLRTGVSDPLVTLGIDSKATHAGQFHLDGSLLAWGAHGGNVYVADLKEVQRRLAEFGLGW